MLCHGPISTDYPALIDKTKSAGDLSHCIKEHHNIYSLDFLIKSDSLIVYYHYYFASHTYG